MVSPYPPGESRTYVQGFAPVPYLPDDFEEVTVVPEDTTNAQRGWAVGPTRYTAVVTDGNRRPAVDGFLGFMNLLESGSVLRSATPIALKLSVAGETVFPETFKATLNGVDITSAFHPGPADGASLTAYLAVGTSPLQAGKNVLITSVDGLVPGTTRSELMEPETNLRVGFKYLRRLIDQYDGDQELALTAFNRGPGTVNKLLRRGRDPDNGYADMVRGLRTTHR